MDSKQWSKVRLLFEGALDLPEAEQLPHIKGSTESVDVVEGALELLEASRGKTAVFEPPSASPAGGAQPIALELTKGCAVGKFRVERRIGSGGMADIYAATQERPSRQVALKVLRGRLSDRAIRRFRFEAEVLGQLVHPTIAQIYDTGETEVEGHTVPFIAMEFVEGARDLISFAREKGLNTDKRLRLFLQFAEAIQYGHEHGVLHRDIKPSNLLVSDDGQPKVIDYGIARAELEENRDQTLTGEVFGTLGYLAPERLRGDRSADIRSEVYSLGAVFFELLTERPPVDPKGLTLLETIERVEHSEPPRASSIQADLPEGIDWIGIKALAIDRNRRYENVGEFVGDVQRLLAGQVVLAGAPSTGYRLRSWFRRNRVLASLVFLALLGTVATIVGTRVGLQRAERQAELNEAALSILEQTLRNANRMAGGVDARVSTVLDIIDSKIEGQFAEQPEVAIRLDTLLATAYLGARNLSDAKRVMDRAEGKQGGRPVDYEQLEAHRAYILQLEGDLEAAELAFTELLAKTPRDGAVQHDEDRLGRLRALIGTLLTQGKAQEAIDLAEAEGIGLEKDYTTISGIAVLRYLGDAYRLTGQQGLSLQAFTRCIAMARTDQTARFELITSLRSAGMAELGRSHTEQAMTYLEEANELAIEFLGDDHPETALTGSVLTDIFMRSGDFERAIEAMDRLRALPAYSKMSARNQAIFEDKEVYVLITLRRNQAALEAAERMMQGLAGKLAPEDPIRLGCEGSYAEALLINERVDEGISLLEELAKRALDSHGPLSTATIGIQQRLMSELLIVEENERVLEMVEQQLESLSGRLSPESNAIWNARKLQASALFALERFDECQVVINQLRSQIDLEAAPSRRAFLDGIDARLRDRL